MNKEQILEIAKNAPDKSNKDLTEARDTLLVEYENTKKLVIDLTRHMEAVEEYYNMINNELGKRTK